MLYFPPFSCRVEKINLNEDEMFDMALISYKEHTLIVNLALVGTNFAINPMETYLFLGTLKKEPSPILHATLYKNVNELDLSLYEEVLRVRNKFLSETCHH